MYSLLCIYMYSYMCIQVHLYFHLAQKSGWGAACIDINRYLNNVEEIKMVFAGITYKLISRAVTHRTSVSSDWSFGCVSHEIVPSNLLVQVSVDDFIGSTLCQNVNWS